MSEYVPTIGLEIHAELKTRTKMFCDSKNDPEEKRPNMNVCPICLAHPGTLPVINREAVTSVLKVGTALGGTLSDYTEFDRKNYFYPDLPKGYQISQYEYPLVSGGELQEVSITRVHLEEDTARSQHEAGETLIDYNRAGIPLMELVTEPDITSPEQAGAFARELQLLLRTLHVSEANMEKGEMRVEANISVAQNGARGTKVEIKNLNSFRSMERAVAFEIERQKKLLARGEAVAQETRGWDEKKQQTFSQRIKETSADYRYFPDPDLPSLRLSLISQYVPGVLRSSMGELPGERRSRYVNLGLKKEDANMFASNPSLGDFFDAAIDGIESGDKRVLLSANYIANDLGNTSRDIIKRDTQEQSEILISVENFRTVMAMLLDGKISSRGAKDILATMAKEGGDPEEILIKLGILQKSGPKELLPVIEQVCTQNPKVVSDYKTGKAAALQFLVGQVMKATKGSADPGVLQDLIKKHIL